MPLTTKTDRQLRAQHPRSSISRKDRTQLDAPDIVFITSHDLGTRLGCYGRKTLQTPALDQLAAEGAMFLRYFCAATACSPSRSVLHTGRYAHANGMLGLAHPPFSWRLHREEKHTAQRLREEGYRTVLVGLQHLTEHPRDLGFDEAIPLDAAPVMADRAIDVLRRDSRADKPLYLEIGFVEAHRPFKLADDQVMAQEGVGETDMTTLDDVEVPPYLEDTEVSRREFAALHRVIRTLDEAVGRILEELQRMRAEEDTWVVFTTDHGVAMPKAKGTLYDPGIRIALLMRWPGGGISGGKSYTEMISNADVYPTLLEGLDVEIGTDLHGRSFWKLLQQQRYEERTEIFTEKTYHTYYEPMRAVRTDTHKLIVNLEVGMRTDIPVDIAQSPIYPTITEELAVVRPLVELYDLERDPFETQNLAGRLETLDVQRELAAHLFRWMTTTGDPILDGPIASPYYENAMGWLRLHASGSI